MVTYSTANGYKPDYLYLMQRMMMDNPEAAVNLAKMVAKQPGPPIDLNTMTDLFLQVASRCYHCRPSALMAAADTVQSQLTASAAVLQRNAVREATAFLLDALQDDKPEHAMLQTKVHAGRGLVGGVSLHCTANGARVHAPADTMHTACRSCWRSIW